MPNQHKRPPVSFRPAEADRAWLYAYAEATGIPVSQVIAAALTMFRAALAGEPYHGPPRHSCPNTTGSS